METNCADKLIRVRILPDDGRYFQVGVSVKDEDKVQMLLFLMQNVDVFAWSPYEVPGVDPEFIVHNLNVDLLFSPKNQKPRRSAKQEVKRLKEAEAIKEIFFPERRTNSGRQMKGLRRFH